MIRWASILNGVVIAYAVDGNNYYRGSCDTNAGETTIEYTLLPAGQTFGYTPYHIGNAAVTTITASDASNLGYTTDGKNWLVTNSPLNSVSEYKVVNGTLYAFASDSYASASSLDLASATWTSGTGMSSNHLTDTLTANEGYYFNYNNPEVRSGAWFNYGNISNGSQHSPALNKTTDNGQTWTTQLLIGVTSILVNGELSPDYKYVTSSVHVIGAQTSSGLQYVKSSDGISFTPLSTSENSLLNRFQGFEYID